MWKCVFSSKFALEFKSRGLGCLDKRTEVVQSIGMNHKLINLEVLLRTLYLEQGVCSVDRRINFK